MSQLFILYSSFAPQTSRRTMMDKVIFELLDVQPCRRLAVVILLSEAVITAFDYKRGCETWSFFNTQHSTTPAFHHSNWGETPNLG